MILKLLPPFLVRLAKRGGKLLFADERAFHPGRGRDLVGGQRPLVKLGAMNLALKVIVAAALVPHPENHLRVASREFPHSSLVGFAIRHAVAIANNRAVLLIYNGHMDRLLVRFVFLQRAE